MPTNTAVRNSKPRFTRQFPVMFDENTLNQLRSISETNALSMGAFVRQSVIRNIKSYRKLELLK